MNQVQAYLQGKICNIMVPHAAHRIEVVDPAATIAYEAFCIGRPYLTHAITPAQPISRSVVEVSGEPESKRPTG